MEAQLIKSVIRDPYYMSTFTYKCIRCGAEYTRCQHHNRISPYCGSCSRELDAKKNKERIQKKKSEEIVRELELLQKDIHNFLMPLLLEDWMLNTVDRICEKHIENVKKGESNVL